MILLWSGARQAPGGWQVGPLGWECDAVGGVRTYVQTNLSLLKILKTMCCLVTLSAFLLSLL